MSSEFLKVSQIFKLTTHVDVVFLILKKNTIELYEVHFNKKERMYMCVLKCHTIERSLYRLRCCKDHCWMQKRVFGVVCDPKL